MKHIGDYIMLEETDMLTGKINQWICKSEKNIDKWGLQNLKDLCLATLEELGELTQAVLQFYHEGQPEYRILEELDDLVPLCFQIFRRIQNGI